MLNEARPTLLVVDDEPNLRAAIAELFAGRGYSTVEAADGDCALALLQQRDFFPDAVFLDLKMPGRGGLATLQAIKADSRLQRIPVVVITAYGGSEQTISAMKAGAYDYVAKPFEAYELLQTADRAIEIGRLNREVALLRGLDGAGRADGVPALLGRHPLMQAVFKQIGRVAASVATVLITGETGTGKEVVARAIHRHSGRAHKAFVVINCAAFPDSLIESELFGYEKGAFTGAAAAKPGRLEMAAGGTLFLDEIGELPLATQVKLLRVLQERSFQRLGHHRDIAADFRLLAATNRDLRTSIGEGRFRKDLFYRLNVVNIELPPLRARRSDIPELAEHFLQVHTAERRSPAGFTDAAVKALLLYDYPGNIRELGNLIQQSAVFAQGALVDVGDLPGLPAGRPADDGEACGALLDMPLDRAKDRLERMLIDRALARAGGNKTEAARMLGVHRQYLYAKLKEFEAASADSSG